MVGSQRPDVTGFGSDYAGRALAAGLTPRRRSGTLSA